MLFRHLLFTLFFLFLTPFACLDHLSSLPSALASVTSLHKMPAPPNYVFTIFSFVAFFLCLIKFPTQFNGRSQFKGVHVNTIAILTTTIQLGMLILTFSWLGLDLNAFSWVLTQLFGTTTRSIGLQSGVI